MNRAVTFPQEWRIGSIDHSKPLWARHIGWSHVFPVPLSHDEALAWAAQSMRMGDARVGGVSLVELEDHPGRVIGVEFHLSTRTATVQREGTDRRTEHIQRLLQRSRMKDEIDKMKGRDLVSRLLEAEAVMDESSDTPPSTSPNDTPTDNTDEHTDDEHPSD